MKSGKFTSIAIAPTIECPSEELPFLLMLAKYSIHLNITWEYKWT
jgi:hypothetical protein